MPVIALYNLNDSTTQALDSATADGSQNGFYFNGATSDGVQAQLDGIDDIVKIINDPIFQLARGTLEIEFTQDPDTNLMVPRTVLSRDSVGNTDGGFNIQTMPDGSIEITHESPTGEVVYNTGPGFMNPGDTINISYSWDAGGDGGFVHINNLTTGDRGARFWIKMGHLPFAAAPSP